jgi:hypothetical protein
MNHKKSNIPQSDLLSEAIINYLFEMANRYGFLILKPYYGNKKPDIQIKIPNAEQRQCIESKE